MKIGRLRPEQVSAVARLHQRHIDQGFLSRLGCRFLGHLYDAMRCSGHAVCLTAEHEGEVHGFISGAFSLPAFYRDFLRRKALPASWCVLPHVIRPAVAIKVAETLRHASKQQSLPAAELMSIAVSEESRGKGIGRSLFQGLVKEFRDEGIVKFKVVAGADLTEANRFYRKMAGVPSGRVSVHGHEVSQVYVWEL